MQLPSPPTCAQLLDTAFRRAKRASLATPGHPDRFRHHRQQHADFVAAFAACLVETMGGAVQKSPDFSTLDPFTRTLAAHTADMDAYRRALGHLQQTLRVVKKIKHASIKEIFETRREQGIERAFEKRKKAVGRMSSAIKRANRSMGVIRENAKRLSELPAIEKDAVHVVLAGFPNAGKTTFLETLTKSRGKIASYPFTTTRLNIGHYEHRWKRIEVIDTPGLLDRNPSERNAVERKAAAALRHVADLVVFIADPTEAGNTLDDQRALLEKVKKEFGKKTYYHVSRVDVAAPEQVRACQSALDGTGTEAFDPQKHT